MSRPYLVILEICIEYAYCDLKSNSVASVEEVKGMQNTIRNFHSIEHISLLIAPRQTSERFNLPSSRVHESESVVCSKTEAVKVE